MYGDHAPQPPFSQNMKGQDMSYETYKQAHDDGLKVDAEWAKKKLIPRHAPLSSITMAADLTGKHLLTPFFVGNCPKSAQKACVLRLFPKRYFFGNPVDYGCFGVV